MLRNPIADKPIRYKTTAPHPENKVENFINRNEKDCNKIERVTNINTLKSNVFTAFNFILPLKS